MSVQAVKAQHEMHQIQNNRGISDAGAFLKYGFHEDDFTSGLLAACSVEDEGLCKRIHEQSSSAGSKPDKVMRMKNVTVCPPQRRTMVSMVLTNDECT
jgi:predicted NAD/FAD-binding protein